MIIDFLINLFGYALLGFIIIVYIIEILVAKAEKKLDEELEYERKEFPLTEGDYYIKK